MKLGIKFFVFKIILAILGLLRFHANFRISFCEFLPEIIS